MMTFFKVLKDVIEKHRDILNIDDKKVLDEKKK